MSVRVLVVDDEVDIRPLFEQQFRKEVRAGRFLLDFALSAEEALAKLRGVEGDTLILLLSDINMPGMSGLEMLPQIKQERPDLPVIMITAYGDEATKRIAAERGAERVLNKPVDFAELRAVIDARIGHAG